MKKILIILSILVLCVGLVGCGKKPEKVAVTELSETDKLLEQLEAQLSGTIWSGLEKDGSAYALHFNGDMLSVWMKEANNETTEGSGNYKLSATNLFVYKDADMQEELMNFAYSIKTDELGQYITLDNEVTLLREQGSDFEETKNKIDIASQYVTYFSEGTYWVGCDETVAYIFCLASDGAYVGLFAIGDDEILTDEVTGDWALNYDNFYLFSEGGGTDIFSWYIEENGDEVMLALRSDGLNLDLYESSAENLQETVEVTAQYLANSRNPGTDLTTLLYGYRGVSIVDGFMRAGYSPSFATRKWCAEQFGLSGYRGSSNENLWLIEAMGGSTR